MCSLKWCFLCDWTRLLLGKSLCGPTPPSQNQCGLLSQAKSKNSNCSTSNTNINRTSNTSTSSKNDKKKQ